MHINCTTDLGRGHNDTSKVIQVACIGVEGFPNATVKVKHGDGGAEKVREVMQQHQAVAEAEHVQALQMIKLHGGGYWQLASIHWLVGRPGQAVC